MCYAYMLTGIVRQLIPPAGSDLRGHLEMLTANDLSVTEFEQRLIDFLDNLLMGQSKPVLMQVELGRVEGLRHIDIDRLSDTIGMA